MNNNILPVAVTIVIYVILIWRNTDELKAGLTVDQRPKQMFAVLTQLNFSNFHIISSKCYYFSLYSVFSAERL